MHPPGPLPDASALASSQDQESPGGAPQQAADDLTLQHRPQRLTYKRPLPVPLLNNITNTPHTTTTDSSRSDGQSTRPSTAELDFHRAGESGESHSPPFGPVMPNDSLYNDMPPIERTRTNSSVRQHHSEEYSFSRSRSGSPCSAHSTSHTESHDAQASRGHLPAPGQRLPDGPSSADDAAFASPSAVPTTAGQSPPRPRRTRALMTRLQADSLNKLWSQTMFPSASERETLAQHIGLTARQVQVWFQNQRQKRRRERESDEAVAASAAAANSVAQTARHRQPVYSDGAYWQRGHISDGPAALSPRWSHRHGGGPPVHHSHSSRYGQPLPISSGIPSSAPMAGIHHSYPPGITTSPPRFSRPDVPALDYRRRGSIEEPDDLHHFGSHLRNRHEPLNHEWRTAPSSGSDYSIGPERPHRPRAGGAWPYRHNTFPWPSAPRRSPEINKGSTRPLPAGRSHTFDEADSRRREKLLHSPSAVSQSLHAHASAPSTTSPRHSNLPPSLAGLVLDPTVDPRLGDHVHVLSPINSLAARDLEPESPTARAQYQHDHSHRADDREESKDFRERPQPAIPSIARLLN